MSGHEIDVEEHFHGEEPRFLPGDRVVCGGDIGTVRFLWSDNIVVVKFDGYEWRSSVSASQLTKVER